MSDIKIVRLSTGEELICEVTVKNEEYNLKDIAILITNQQNSLGLAPFMAYSDTDKGMTIEKHFIMFMVDPVEDLANQYKNMFSKVLTQSKKIII